MDRNERPRIVISKCIKFASCRWNGLMITSGFVKKLRDHAEFVPVCAEMEIGLGVPRKPLRLVGREDSVHMVQSETMLDVTGPMQRFANGFLDTLERVEGFILKDRSPSCGNKDVKVYPKMGKVAPSTTKGSGLFGKAVLERFSHSAVENEGRLNSFRMREHFLTKLFTLARFRTVKEAGGMNALVQFHTENKYILMAYNQSAMRLMGRLTANPGRKDPREVIGEYENLLTGTLAKLSRYTSNINVLMHALGYFKEGLQAAEKSFFLDTIERYRKGKVPLSVCTEIVRSWIVRFSEPYLTRQTYFSPYPEDLVEITDSGKGRGTG